ncbi:hypothetical protein PENTCL1PPCAC_27311 [Pristionchus entomophagus]|uniref:Uncharacterized protein n=1 Tax=Pristionchus entomophagus TaxID=358040 RepID=A0AAV5UE25_9BILA|nr:hypothetical protein PENTCL1PPCAC_27311 [Pristionchus entomophagus]
MQSSVMVALLCSLLTFLCLVHSAPVQPDRSEEHPLRQLIDSNGYEGYEWTQPVFHKRGAAFYPARGKKSLPISDMDRLADQYFDLPQF